LVGKVGRDDEHRQNNDNEREHQQQRSGRAVAEPATNQSLTYRPSRGRQCRAEQNRGRERLHDRQNADKEADNKQHENAAFNQCHPPAIVGGSLVGLLTEFIGHGLPPSADWRFDHSTISTRNQVRSGSSSFVAAA